MSINKSIKSLILLLTTFFLLFVSLCAQANPEPPPEFYQQIYFKNNSNQTLTIGLNSSVEFLKPVKVSPGERFLITNEKVRESIIRERPFYITFNISNNNEKNLFMDIYFDMRWLNPIFYIVDLPITFAPSFTMNPWVDYAEENIMITDSILLDRKLWSSEIVASNPVSGSIMLSTESDTIPLYELSYPIFVISPIYKLPVENISNLKSLLKKPKEPDTHPVKLIFHSLIGVKNFDIENNMSNRNVTVSVPSNKLLMVDYMPSIYYYGSGSTLIPAITVTGTADNPDNYIVIDPLNFDQNISVKFGTTKFIEDDNSVAKRLNSKIDSKKSGYYIIEGSKCKGSSCKTIKIDKKGLKSLANKMLLTNFMPLPERDPEGTLVNSKTQ